MTNYHRIEVTIESQGYIRGEMKCDAPEGAQCRLWCNHECECESIDGHGPDELHDQGYCTRIEGWFDDEIFDCYSGVEAPFRSGPVDLVWEGDYYTWQYAAQSPEQESGR